MKVLIIGSYGFFMNFLIRRLSKEGMRIYTVTGRNSRKKGEKLPYHVNYEFDAESKDISVVLKSVGADYIIFLGAADDRYMGEDFNADMLCRFMGELTNVLSSVPKLNTRKVIFLSSAEVYEEKKNVVLLENAKVLPDSDKRKAFLNGEQTCSIFSWAEPYQLVVLRLSRVYGPLDQPYEYCNDIVELCYETISRNEIRVNVNAERSYVYISDAVDAVYKSMVHETPKEICLNIGGDSRNEREVAALAAKCYEISQNTVEYSGESLHFKIDSHAEEAIGYRAAVSLEQGVEKTAAWTWRNRKAAEKALERKRSRCQERDKQEYEDVMRSIRKGIWPFLENLILFVIAAAATLLWGDHAFFSKIDFFVIYILLISVVHGAMHGYLSVMLSTAFGVWQLLQSGVSFGELVTSYENIIYILFYLIVCIISSYSRDHFLTLVQNQSESLDDLSEELDHVMMINGENEQLCKEYEQRILSSRNSIGRIYEIVSRLNTLSPDLFIKELLEVVKELLEVKEVSIYFGGDQGFYRLMANSRIEEECSESLNINTVPEIRDELLQDHVYMNRQLKKEYPSMAAPVFSEDKVIAIILIWNVPYERMNLDSANLLAVLCKIAESAFENAYAYQKAVRKEEYWEGTALQAEGTVWEWHDT